MPVDRAKILVIGANSRIASIIMPRFGEAAVGVVRRPGARTTDLLVPDYDHIPPQAFRDVDCVINCVGTSTGRAAELRHVNVAIPSGIAAAAKAAGVAHLIHISSFSVYGGARSIDRHTPPAPSTAYGRSKLAADQALLALSDDRFAVTILRLPLIYDRDTPGKLGQLLRWWIRAGMVPVPAGDVTRAMIGVDLAAEVVARRIADARTEIVFAADPQPFTYRDAARARPERLRRWPIPRALARMVERAAPAIGSRLFADSRLADADNLAIRYRLPSRLYRDIAAFALR